MLRSNGHASRCVDVLKMDVEGVEEAVLPSLDWSRLCVGLLLVELHGGGRTSTIGSVCGHRAHKVQSARTPHCFCLCALSSLLLCTLCLCVVQVLDHIRKLEAAGFLHYSSEVVCSTCNGQTELAFINASWLTGMMLADGARARGAAWV